MSFSKWIPKRLWQQIFVILLCLVIIPLIILGALLIHTSQKAIEETVSRDLGQIALHATGEVLKEYEGAYQALDATAAILGTLHADRWRQETALVELSLKHPSFRHICSLDMQGQVVACSDESDALLGDNNRYLIECVRNGGGQCVSKVRIASDYVPVINIGVSIRHYGRIEGILVAQYSLRGIWEVMDQIQFGPQSQAILVDQNGQILAHPDKKEVLKNNTFSHFQSIRDLDQGRNSARMVKDNKGVAWIVAYSPISSLNWGLIVAQPYAQAFAFLRVMHYHSWMLVLLSILAAALIGFILARWMSKPMQEMIHATRRLAHGDLSITLPIDGRDDVNRWKFAFNHMTSQLKKARQVERLSIVGKSAASIAHELKNSLVLVKSFVQLIPQRHQDKAFVRESTDTIARELDNWNSMLRNMMDFAKDQIPLHLDTVNLNALVDEVSLLAKLRMEEMGISFSLQISPEVPFAMADEGKIKQVLINLMANALDATPYGGKVAVNTFFISSADKQFAGFEVVNSGEGISPEHLTQIFDPFFTTKDAGLGLGLAISQDIVRKHNGRLEAVSQKGVGSTFRVLLPAVFIQEKQEERGIHDFRKDCRS